MLERPIPPGPQPRGKKVNRIAWFTPEEYESLLKAVKDNKGLAEDFDNWHVSARKRLMDIVAKGERAVKVPVDVKAFKKWCKEHKKSVDSESLDQYVTLPHGG
jgi:hypothetical protein